MFSLKMITQQKWQSLVQKQILVWLGERQPINTVRKQLASSPLMEKPCNRNQKSASSHQLGYKAQLTKSKTILGGSRKGLQIKEENMERIP